VDVLALSDVTLVDTDILIDASRQIQEAITCLEQIEQNSSLGISAITHMELIVGCRNKLELQVIERFLIRFQIVSLNGGITAIATDLLRQYRLSHGLAIPDALIAATALFLGQYFVTKNQRDYRFINGLRLLPYPLPQTTA